MNTLQFDFHPSSTSGIGDGVTDGNNPIKEILQAQGRFLIQFYMAPQNLVIHPDDRKLLSENRGVVDTIGRGRFLADDGVTLVAIPFLKIRESSIIRVGTALLEADEW